MTMYARMVNGAVAEYPYSLAQLRADMPNASVPAKLTPAIMAELGIAHVIVTGQPEHDPATHTVIEGPPIPVYGTSSYLQTWTLVPL